MIGSTLLSVVLLLRSSLAAGSAKPAPPLSSCVPSIFCLFVLLSSVASSPRCQRVCPLPGGLRASLPLNNTLFVRQICFLLTHVEGATRHIFSIPGMFQCALVPVLSAKFLFMRMTTGQAQTIAKQTDHETHRAQFANQRRSRRSCTTSSSVQVLTVSRHLEAL